MPDVIINSGSKACVPKPAIPYATGECKMTEGFSSKALEANLARTRDTDIHIPEDQQWLIDLSNSKWGINKRTREFITELNHKYRNDQYVIDSLHNICLTDLWFYNSVDESERALSVLLDILNIFSIPRWRKAQESCL